MQQLLQITVTTPKVEYDIEHAKLEYNQNVLPTANVKTSPSEFKVDKVNTELKIDTYKAQHSLGFRTSADHAQDLADKGSRAIQEYTRNQVSVGKQLANIQDGVTIGQVISQKMLEQPNAPVTVFLPSNRAEISWQPPEINMSFRPEETTYDWQVEREKMDYIPGKIQLRMLGHNKVDIRYTGDPMYVPASADPKNKG